MHQALGPALLPNCLARIRPELQAIVKCTVTLTPPLRPAQGLRCAGDLRRGRSTKVVASVRKRPHIGRRHGSKSAGASFGASLPRAIPGTFRRLSGRSIAIGRAPAEGSSKRLALAPARCPGTAECSRLRPARLRRSRDRLHRAEAERRTGAALIRLIGRAPVT